MRGLPPDRIRDLCTKALKAQSPEFEQIMKELRKALHQHIGFTRTLALQVLKRAPADPTRDPGLKSEFLGKKIA